MLVEDVGPIFNLSVFISNVNKANKFFVHYNHKLINCYNWVKRNEQLIIIKQIKINVAMPPVVP